VQRSRYSSFQENGVVAVELDMQLLGDRIVFIRNSWGWYTPANSVLYFTQMTFEILEVGTARRVPSCICKVRLCKGALRLCAIVRLPNPTDDDLTGDSSVWTMGRVCTQTLGILSCFSDHLGSNRERSRHAGWYGCQPPQL
jgi:hypothetical protein